MSNATVEVKPDASLLSMSGFARRFAWPHWRWYLAGIVTLLATNAVTLYIPVLAKKVVDAIGTTVQPDQLTKLCLAIVGLGVLQILIRAVSRIFVFWPGRALETDIKDHLFNRAIRLPMQKLQEFGLGDLISRIANDTSHLRIFFAFGILQILNMFFLMLFVVSQMLATHVLLTVLSLAPLVLMLVITRAIMPRMQSASRQNQEAVGRLTNRVTEAFVNIHVIQSSHAETAVMERCNKENEDVFASNMRLVVVRTLMFPFMTCLSGVSRWVVLFYGGILVINQTLTIGDILAFNVFIGLLSFPLTAVGIILNVYQRAQTALERIHAIDVAPAESSSTVPRTLSVVDKPINIRNLSFSYPGQNRSVLSDVNLTVAQGEKIGIWGPIGSGKSTLLSLIVRLWDPPPGTIFVFGRDVLTIPVQELRRMVGMALQTPHLFSDSISGNLGFGITAPTESTREAAVRRAVLDSDLQTLSQGYATEVGEKGVRLSGGQKQRLALARIFCREAKIFLLDDVLSAVDQATESQLIENLSSQSETTLIATHRPSVLSRCDRVVEIRDGRLSQP